MRIAQERSDHGEYNTARGVFISGGNSQTDPIPGFTIAAQFSVWLAIGARCDRNPSSGSTRRCRT